MNDSTFLSKTIGDLQLSLSAFGDEALVPSLLGFGDRPDAGGDTGVSLLGADDDMNLDASTADALSASYFDSQLRGLTQQTKLILKEENQSALKEYYAREAERRSNLGISGSMTNSEMNAVLAGASEAVSSSPTSGTKTAAVAGNLSTIGETIYESGYDSGVTSEDFVTAVLTCKDYHEFVSGISPQRKGSTSVSVDGGSRVQSRLLEIHIRPDISAEDVKEMFVKESREQGFTISKRERNIITTEKKQYDIKGATTGNSHIATLIMGLSKNRTRIALIKVLVGAYEDEVADKFLYRMKELFYRHQYNRSSLGDALSRQSADGKVISLDRSYIEDLEESFQREMKVDLAAFIEPLDKCARDAEYNCALFITALDPCFTANSVPISTPLRAPSVNDFPMDVAAVDPPNNEVRPGSSVADVVITLDTNIKRYISEICKSQMQARMNQKKLQVIKRVEACELHKCQLLEEIYNHKGIMASPLHKDFVPLFKTGYDEIVLVECMCMMGKWPGKMWITYKQIAFYSNMALFKKKESYAFESIEKIFKVSTTLGLGDSLCIKLKNGKEEIITVAAAIDRFVEVAAQLIKLTKSKYDFNTKNAIDMTATMIMSDMLSPGKNIKGDSFASRSSSKPPPPPSISVPSSMTKFTAHIPLPDTVPENENDDDHDDGPSDHPSLSPKSDKADSLSQLSFHSADSDPDDRDKSTDVGAF